jgi:FHS family Na+ dependent glucose MFS transporter 1
LIASALIAAGVASIFIPLVSAVLILGVVVFFQGFAMGQLDCGANVLLIYLWEVEVGPWMQTLHASFAVGAFFAPILIVHFVLLIECASASPDSVRPSLL